MLKLFQSIFGLERGGDEGQGRYPESLIEMAIERAIDGTDPRMRAVSGYKKRLRSPVIHAIDHVVALVDGFPAPLVATRSDFSTDPRLMALFASAEHMLEVFGSDAVLNAFRDSAAGSAERVTALLLAERVEKNVLGMDMDGGMLRREVAQVAINFRSHRLLEAAADESDTRRQLKRRAFDHLLTLALTRITEAQSERADLARQRDLLRRKLSTLERSGWSFEAVEVEGARPEPSMLLAELEAIETELANLGVDAGALQTRLDVLVDVLGHAEQQLWSKQYVTYLDRMNIQRDVENASASRIALQELHNARGRRLAVLMISLAPGELPRREDIIAAAERYLI